jgi:hypothetical protein
MADFRGGGGGWGGFGEYMRDKSKKLASQYGQRFGGDGGIFRGKTFWSTGRLEGIDFDVKETISANGGSYEQYGFRNVSHIIASNVALSNQNWKKLLGGRHASKPYCLVTPQWIVDSLQAGKSLPESEYLPDCIRVSGTLDAFLHTSRTSVFTSPDHESTSTSISPPTEAHRTRVIRSYIASPRCTLTVIDELCLGLLSYDNKLIRRGILSIQLVDSVNVFSLPEDRLRSSLAEALLAELQDRDWMDVVSLTLTVYLGSGGTGQLRVFPAETEPPPSLFNSSVLNLSRVLYDVDEDSLQERLHELFTQAGSSLHAIIIDTLNHYIVSKRSDIARDILIAIKRICGRSGDEGSLEWHSQIVETADEIFGWHSDGMQLGL